jgi:hypothetical protein
MPHARFRHDSPTPPARRDTARHKTTLALGKATLAPRKATVPPGKVTLSRRKVTDSAFKVTLLGQIRRNRVTCVNVPLIGTQWSA